jgi:hypothetical protein
MGGDCAKSGSAIAVVDRTTNGAHNLPAAFMRVSRFPARNALAATREHCQEE